MSATPQLLFDFNAAFNQQQLATMLKNVVFPGGGSANITAALNFVQTQVLDRYQKSREIKYLWFFEK